MTRTVATARPTIADGLIFHYSCFRLLPSMLQAGAILPSGAEGPIPPAVWCSTARKWESIAAAAVDLDLDSTAALQHSYYGDRVYDRPMRIAVQPEVVQEWGAALLSRGVDQDSIFHLAQVGYDWGSDPEDWLVSFVAIAVRDWLNVDVWVDRWRRLFDVDHDGKLVAPSRSDHHDIRQRDVYSLPETAAASADNEHDRLECEGRSANRKGPMSNGARANTPNNLRPKGESQ